MKAAQKIVESEIIRSMKENSIPQFDLPKWKDSTLKTKESKKAVTPKWIKEELGKLPESTRENVKGIIEKIDNRPTTSVKESLVHKE